MLNVDHVLGKERNKTLSLLNTGKIFNLGFRKINQTEEIMYGSSIGESDYSYNFDLSNYLVSNIVNSSTMYLQRLRELDAGTYKEPVKSTPKSMYDAYANFFN
jgi:hypothetical protein